MSSIDRYIGRSYEDSNPTWHEEDSPWKAGKIADFIRHNEVQFDTCVEIGCGAGRVLASLFQSFPDVRFSGWDIAPGLADRWRALDGIEFHCGDVTASGGHYDLALSIDVFEHVEDYIGFLRACRPLASTHIFHIPLEMNVGSVLLDRQINARSSVGHLHYFSRATAIATLVDAGYRVIDQRFTCGVLELPSARGPLTRFVNPIRSLCPP